MCCSIIKRWFQGLFTLGSPIKSYCHQTIQGKRRFSFLILLSPYFIVTRQTMGKKQTARTPTPHHTHLQSLHHATPLHITTLPNLINLDQKRTPHLYNLHSTTAKTHQSEPCQKLINLNPTTTPHCYKSKHCRHSSICHFIINTIR